MRCVPAQCTQRFFEQKYLCNLQFARSISGVNLRLDKTSPLAEQVLSFFVEGRSVSDVKLAMDGNLVFGKSARITPKC